MTKEKIMSPEILEVHVTQTLMLVKAFEQTSGKSEKKVWLVLSLTI